MSARARRMFIWLVLAQGLHLPFTIPSGRTEGRVGAPRTPITKRSQSFHAYTVAYHGPPQLALAYVERLYVVVSKETEV
jgi:hypothetical protein